MDSEVHEYTDDTVQNIRTTQAPGTTLSSFQMNEGPVSDLGQFRVRGETNSLRLCPLCREIWITPACSDN